MRCPQHRPRRVGGSETASHFIHYLYCTGCDRSYTRRQKKTVQKLSPQIRTQTAKNTKNALKRLKTRKKGIPRKSDSKDKWTRLYHDAIDRDTLFGVYYDLEWRDGEPVAVRKIGNRLHCERHHPLGRHYCRIIFYRFVTKELHKFCHDKARKSREIGTILPEFEGRDSQEGQMDPFEILPEYHKYIETHGLK